MRRKVALAALIAVLAGGASAEEATTESANPLGLQTCQLPVYGVAPDPDAEPDADSAGYLLPDGTCLQVTGYATLATQRNRATAHVGSLLGRLAGGNTTSSSVRPSSLSGGFTASTGRIVNGLFFGITVSGDGSDTSGSNAEDGRFYFSEASVRVERLLVGYASSRFNFWDSGDFWTGTVYPSRSAPLAALDVWKADGLTITFSVERPQLPESTAPQGPLAVLFTATNRDSNTPDFVGSVTHEGDEWTLFAAVAVRQLHLSTNNATEPGFAATFGASYEGEIFGATHRFSTQASIARNLPSYLGTTFDTATIRSLIGGGENIRGYSAVASIGRDITDEIQVNAYASVLDIEFPALLQPGTGRVFSTRAAANIIYNPVEHLRFGLEYGLGRLDLTLPVGGRPPILPAEVQLSPTGRTRVDASSVTAWVEVSF